MSKQDLCPMIIAQVKLRDEPKLYFPNWLISPTDINKYLLVDPQKFLVAR